MLGLCLFFEFKNDYFNAMILISTPHMIIVFLVNDIQSIFSEPSLLNVLDILTKHLPVACVGVFLLWKVLVPQKKSGKLDLDPILWSHLIVYAWFFILDDHDNGSLTGIPYIIAMMSVSIVWVVVYILVYPKIMEKLQKNTAK